MNTPPIVYAVIAMDFELVVSRHLSGADINYIDPEKGSAIMQAVHRDLIEISEYLLKNGCDIWIKGPHGKSAIEFTKSLKLSEMLNRFGAGIELRNIDSEMMLELNRSTGTNVPVSDLVLDKFQKYDECENPEFPDDFNWWHYMSKCYQFVSVLYNNKISIGRMDSSAQDASFTVDIEVFAKDASEKVSPVWIRFSHFGDMVSYHSESGQVKLPSKIIDLLNEMKFDLIDPAELSGKYIGKFKFTDWGIRYFDYL
jgi:hypothetical protein